MGDLILVKHAAPRIIPEIPSKDWTLSDTGRRQSDDLVHRLAPYGVSTVVTSEEPKAVETGAIVGLALGVPHAPRPGLQENDRTGLPFFDDEGDLRERIRAFFRRPKKRLIGEETADEAHRRFSAAVGEAVAVSEAPLVVVSHGTVMSLLVSRANQLDPYGLWRGLDFTSFVVLSPVTFGLVRVVHPSDGAKSGSRAQ